MSGREAPRPPKRLCRQALLSLVTVVVLLPRKPRCHHEWEDEMCVPTNCRLCGRRGYPTASMHDFGDD